MSLYPLTVRETVRTTGGEVEIAAVITREGWTFAGTVYRALFDGLRAGERLTLRRAFAAQVALAQNTPTKGPTMESDLNAVTTDERARVGDRFLTRAGWTFTVQAPRNAAASDEHGVWVRSSGPGADGKLMFFGHREVARLRSEGAWSKRP